MTFAIGQPAIESEFASLLRGPSRRKLTSRGLNWEGYAIEEHSLPPGELFEAASPHVLLSMWRGTRSTGERALEGGRFVPWVKYPGECCLLPAGHMPAVRPFTQSHLLFCALDPSLVEKVEAEMDRRPPYRMRSCKNFQDPVVRQLLLLLEAEAAQGGPLGRLYADHLIQALITKILWLGGTDESRSRFEESALPRHLIQRVIERMHDFSQDLDLAILAAETGFSPRHFVRMFRSATGRTPHRFLTDLRLMRAKELMRQRHVTLIDIAADCGFSSHSHMSSVFRKVLGVTPSEYRNKL